MDDGRTWWKKGGLFGWNYRPMARSDGRMVPRDLSDPETRRRWLCDLVGRLPSLLGDFGSLYKVRVGAHGKGDDACVVEWRDKAGPSTLLAFIQRETIWNLEADVDLICLDRDLEPLEIMGGADFLINIRLTDSGDLDATEDVPVYLRLELNADIYSPRTFGEIRDNALLAALNGPRLTHLLERIENEVPAELLEIDQDRYPRGTAGPRGFNVPKGTLDA